MNATDSSMVPCGCRCHYWVMRGVPPFRVPVRATYDPLRQRISRLNGCCECPRSSTEMP
jgi:hypothetical protein